jgi:hypothetical protein
MTIYDDGPLAFIDSNAFTPPWTQLNSYCRLGSKGRKIAPAPLEAICSPTNIDARA